MPASVLASQHSLRVVLLDQAYKVVELWVELGKVFRALGMLLRPVWSSAVALHDPREGFEEVAVDYRQAVWSLSSANRTQAKQPTYR